MRRRTHTHTHVAGWLAGQVVRLRSGLVFAEAHTNPDDLNHAIELYYQVPLHKGARGNRMRRLEWE